ncbi:unnamed protein product, partial [Closterium sp. Naga37s-1]
KVLLAGYCFLLAAVRGRLLLRLKLGDCFLNFQVGDLANSGINRKVFSFFYRISLFLVDLPILLLQ